MFTGLIEATGTLRRVAPLPKGVTLTIGAPRAMVAELVLGESVACDGACLTVTRWADDWFSVDASAETMARTTLGERRPGQSLHLERATKVGDRLGGHIVAGHVDATGRLVRKAPLGEAVELEFSAPPAVARYLVEKGSIAIDGVSLTVNDVYESSFRLTIIPITMRETLFGTYKKRGRVNIETDMFARYIAHFLAHRKPTLDWETAERFTALY